MNENTKEVMKQWGFHGFFGKSSPAKIVRKINKNLLLELNRKKE